MSLLFEGRYAPPAPEAIPQPDPHQGRPPLALAQPTPGRYVDTIARVDFFKVSERYDQLGRKPVYSGVLEDSTFRVPFISHKTSLPLERNAVFRIRSAYVHEFQDRSILLILTEYSRIQPVPVDRRLIEKLLEFKIREITGKPLLHGPFLLDEPIPLYGCERARLYLGFTIRARLLDGKVVIEASPQALVRESVWEYVKWRRGRGASANAIERMLKTYRSHVLLAPLGQLGHIEGLIFKRAGEQPVSDSDRRNLVEFWRDVYGIEVEPEETPLLKVRLMNSEQLFTYPPSTAYFDGNLLYIPAGTQRFIEMKKSSLKDRVRAVLTRALQDLSIGGQTLHLLEEEQSVDVQSLLLSDIRQKLIGRRIKARGPVIQLLDQDQLCFFPQRILQVS